MPEKQNILNIDVHMTQRKFIKCNNRIINKNTEEELIFKVREFFSVFSELTDNHDNIFPIQSRSNSFHSQRCSICLPHPNITQIRLQASRISWPRHLTNFFLHRDRLLAEVSMKCRVETLHFTKSNRQSVRIRTDLCMHIFLV